MSPATRESDREALWRPSEMERDATAPGPTETDHQLADGPERRQGGGSTWEWGKRALASRLAALLAGAARLGAERSRACGVAVAVVAAAVKKVSDVVVVVSLVSLTLSPGRSRCRCRSRRRRVPLELGPDSVEASFSTEKTSISDELP